MRRGLLFVGDLDFFLNLSFLLIVGRSIGLEWPFDVVANSVARSYLLWSAMSILPGGLALLFFELSFDFELFDLDFLLAGAVLF